MPGEWVAPGGPGYAAPAPASVRDAAALIACPQLRDTARNVEVPLGFNGDFIGYVSPAR